MEDSPIPICEHKQFINDHIFPKYISYRQTTERNGHEAQTRHYLFAPSSHVVKGRFLSILPLEVKLRRKIRFGGK